MKNKININKIKNKTWADIYYIVNVCKKLLGMKKKIPDISTCFYVKDNWEYFTGLRSYRIEFWLKAIPISPPIIKDIYSEINNELFLEYHPNWQNEYKLVYCKRDEATHVSGRGVSGRIACIEDCDILFDYKYVAWKKETIDEYEKTANEWAERQINDPSWFYGHQVIILGKKHE